MLSQEIPAFAQGYPTDMSALRHEKAVQVLFHLVHGVSMHGNTNLEASLLTVATV